MLFALLYILVGETDLKGMYKQCNYRAGAYEHKTTVKDGTLCPTSIEVGSVEWTDDGVVFIRDHLEV